MAAITLDGVVKIYPFISLKGAIFGHKKIKEALLREKSQPYTTSEGVIAVRRTSLTIPDGSFTVLTGPSGCGKTTILRMIAGLESLTDGEIYYDSKPMSGVKARERNVALISQNLALYPHLTVYDNLAFTLRNEHMPRHEIEDKVRRTAETLKISKLLYKRPKELSGGERQRVAIGRALVRDPAAFLCDEPFSNLDAAMRVTMRGELRRLYDKLGKTFIYVTHDQTEALTMGDRLVVMEDGLISQAGTPKEVYSRPSNLFTAGFIGTPRMNFIKDASLILHGGEFWAEYGSLKIKLYENIAARLKSKGVKPGKVILGIRPVYLRPAREGLEAKILYINTYWDETHIVADANGTELISVVPASEAISGWFPGTMLILNAEGHRVHLFDTETGNNLLL